MKQINGIEIISLALPEPTFEPSSVPSAGPSVSMEPSASPAPSSAPTVKVTEYFVNCGGNEYQSYVMFEADNDATVGGLYHETGRKYSVGSSTRIAGTTDQDLFRSERYQAMTWNFPVPPGDYDVDLHFAEVRSFEILGLLCRCEPLLSQSNFLVF